MKIILEYSLYTQRCWFVYIFQMHKNGRRNVMRRYFLGNAQSEERFVNYKIGIVYIFYMHNVVALSTNSKHTKMGGTLPAFKYEIKDVCLCPAVRKRNLWFRIWALRGYFTRLGTGSSIVAPYVVTYASRYNAYKSLYKKTPWKCIFPRCFHFKYHQNSSLKWMNNAALQEATNQLFTLILR